MNLTDGGELNLALRRRMAQRAVDLELVRKALGRARGNRTDAAHLLGVSLGIDYPKASEIAAAADRV